MKKKRISIALTLAMLTCPAWAQMTLSFPGIEGVTTQELATGCTLVEFPVGTDLATVLQKASFTVDGESVDASHIVPQPSSLSLKDDQELSFLYKGKAYGFKFSEGKYFTAVFLSDPHIGQSDHDGTSVEDMQNYVSKIVNMGKSGGAIFSFDALAGYIPTCDIAFSTGDMDADHAKNHNDFKTAHAGFNNAGIPFITMCGNHDLVPDYWTGDNPDKGLTYGSSGGSNSNDVSRKFVEDCWGGLNNYGITDVETINDGTAHPQFNPFSFTFHSVRFYVGQTYWFQKPYDKPGLFSSAKYYAPDGIISALETFVSKHTSEPSVWMQHYPFLAGSDCDRWWLDQNDVGKYIKTSNASAYGTSDDVAVYTEASAKAVAKKKKDKLAEIINQTYNPVHFSGHTHQFALNTYNGIKDYTTGATGYSGNPGAAYIVLMKGNKGVVEVKAVQFDPEVMTGVSDKETSLLPNTQASTAPKLKSALENLGIDLSAATPSLEDATTQEGLDNSVKSMTQAFEQYIQENGGTNVDVTKLLGNDTDFETAQGSANTTLPAVYSQTGWNEYVESFSSTGNTQYIKLQQSDVKASGNMGMYLRAKWQDRQGKVQIVKQTALAAGIYKLRYHACIVGSLAQDLNYAEVDGKRIALSAPTLSSASLQDQQEVILEVKTPSLLTLSFGFVGGQGGTESSVYVDDISLVYQGSKLVPGTDLSGYIKNSSFNEGTVSKGVQGSGGKVEVPANWDFQYNYDGWNDTFASDGLFNAWANTINRAELSQKLTLPNGAYRLTAEVKTDTEADASTIALYGAASNGNVGRSNEVGKGNGDFNTYSCAFDVTDGTVTIGIRSDKAYYQVKNFQLTYLGETADEETASSYLRQDYYWNGRNNLEFDATGEKYAQAKNVVVYAAKKNQLIKAASFDQFANSDNKIVDGVCKRLVVSDQDEFHTSQDFTANEAIFNRTFTQGMLSTICLPFGISEASGKFYSLSHDQGDYLIFTETTSADGNTPYIYKASADGQLTATNASIQTTPEKMESTPTASGFYMKGVYTTTSVNNIYGFSTQGELLKASVGTMNPFRAFIQSPEDVNNAKAWKTSFGDIPGGDPTGIEQIAPNDEGTVNVIDLGGRVQKVQVDASEALLGLAPGTYILMSKEGARKVVKR